MKRKHGALALIIIIIVGLTFTLLTLMKDTPEEVISFPYNFQVKDHLGFSLDTDKLYFGGGIAGFVLERKLEVSSPFDAMVHIDSEGPGLVTVDENDFFLKANESRDLVFHLKIPDDLPVGAYEGIVILSFYEK